MSSVADRVVAEVDRAVDEIVQFTADLVRIPTVNPPGEAYEECARFIGNHLAPLGHSTSSTSSPKAGPSTPRAIRA